MTRRKPPETPASGNGAGLLWNRRFLALNGAVFLAFANIAAFFQYYDYLHTLDIDVRWFGVLMGVFSGVALVLRPVISPLLHAGNAARWIAAGNTGALLCLASYGLADGFWSMFLLRTIHGLAHVILATGLMTLLVEHIPQERSGQAFGLISIVTLLPYAVVPPALPVLTEWLGGYDRVLLLFAAVMLFVFPFTRMGSSSGEPLGSQAPSWNGALSRREYAQDLKDPKVLLLLSIMLLFFSGYALVFYFLAGFGHSIGLAGVGFFFTLSSVSEIGVRVVLGSQFDRWDKARMCAAAMGAAAVGYAVLPHVDSPAGFFFLGAFLGLGWGVIMPMLNALMFDVSPPRFRALNVNLGLQMYQGGFFLGPFAGGFLVAHAGFTALFSVCALLSLFSVVLLVLLNRVHPGRNARVAASDSLLAEKKGV